MILKLLIFVVAGTFFFLWQEEKDKRIVAEKEIKELKKQLKKEQKKQSPPQKRKSGFATIEKSSAAREYTIKKPQPQAPQPLLDQKKLAELQKQTKAAQGMLAEIFVQEEEPVPVVKHVPDNSPMLDLLAKLFAKEVWTRKEIQEMAGPDVMIGSLLEQINDFSCSKIDDIVVEEDEDKIYVTTEYKEQLI